MSADGLFPDAAEARASLALAERRRTLDALAARAASWSRYYCAPRSVLRCRSVPCHGHRPTALQINVARVLAHQQDVEDYRDLLLAARELLIELGDITTRPR